jgi:hypothetical protein
MNESHASPGCQRSTVHGDVTIAGPGSGVNIAKGDNNYQEITSAPPRAEIRDPWEALGAELTRIRQCLEGDDGRVPLDGRDDAFDAVTDMQRILPDMEKGGANSPKKIKRRIRELIGVLGPVTEIIGGVAGLEAIWQHF